MGELTGSLPRPRLHQQARWRDVTGFLFLALMVLVALNLISARYLVDGESMRPNLADNEVLYISRLHYLIGAPQRYDVAVFHHPATGEDDYIKRIIGLPGERVEIRNTQVLVNDITLDEQYVLEPCTALRCRDDQWNLGPDEYFVMGDNRNLSTDSRVFGPVARHDFVGKAVLRYWPPAAWGIIDHAGP